jgi:ferredoxin
VIIDIDRPRCEGHGLCEGLAPAVFRLDDVGILHVAAEIPDSTRDTVAAAVRSCPVAALRVRS